MQVSTIKGHTVARHDDLTEFYDLVSEPYKGRSNAIPWQAGDVEFRGTRNMAESQDLARNGWHDIRSAVLDKVAQLDGEVRPMVDLSLTPVFEVSGGAVDIDRYLTAEPENMIESTLTPTTKHGRVVNVLIGSMASCGVPKRQLIERGTVLLALAELLRLSGLSMELWAECRMSPRGGKGKSLSQVVRILKAGDPIDIDNLMFPMAHPSMLRRMFFGGLDYMNDHIDATTFGSGSYYGYPPFENLCADIVGADIDVPSPMARRDPITKNPTVWLTEKLTELGVIN